MELQRWSPLNKDLIYFGNWVDQKREGKGIEETNEHFYEGEFFNNKKEGMGKQTFKTLDEEYEGEFKDDQMNGKAIMYYKNGDKY